MSSSSSSSPQEQGELSGGGHSGESPRAGSQEGNIRISGGHGGHGHGHGHGGGEYRSALAALTGTAVASQGSVRGSGVASQKLGRSGSGRGGRSSSRRGDRNSSGPGSSGSHVVGSLLDIHSMAGRQRLVCCIGDWRGVKNCCIIHSVGAVGGVHL